MQTRDEIGSQAGLLSAGIRLVVVRNALEADTLCGFLRVNGVECEHRQTNLGAGATDATGDVGPREVLVPVAQLAQARELLDTTEDRRP